MAKKHLKRITVPASWMVDRKGSKFIARPNGSFSLETGMPLITVLKEVLNLVNTRREGRRVLNSKEISVNGVRRKSEKFMIGLMDVLGIKELGISYRMLLDANGVLRLVPIGSGESAIKPCKIIGKRAVRKGKVQLSLHNGHTCIGEAAHETGSTVVLALPKGGITQHLKMEKGSHAYLIGGSNVGRTGVIDSVSGDKVAIKMESGDGLITAAKRFVFVIGKEKPVIKVAAWHGG